MTSWAEALEARAASSSMRGTATCRCSCREGRGSEDSRRPSPAEGPCEGVDSAFGAQAHSSVRHRWQTICSHDG